MNNSHKDSAQDKEHDVEKINPSELKPSDKNPRNPKTDDADLNPKPGD